LFTEEWAAAEMTNQTFFVKWKEEEASRPGYEYEGTQYVRDVYYDCYGKIDDGYEFGVYRLVGSEKAGDLHFFCLGSVRVEPGPRFLFWDWRSKKYLEIRKDEVESNN
jgi:hypothetical protein